jgi:hypothetical protein
MKATFSRRVLAAMALIFVFGFSLAPIGIASAANAAATSRSRVTGKWDVTYGNAAVVKIKRTGHHAYTMTGLTPIELTSGSSCRLPVGTVIATFSGKGTTFTGQHGLWYDITSTCESAGTTTLTMTLSGNTIVGHLGNGETHTYTRVRRRSASGVALHGPSVLGKGSGGVIGPAAPLGAATALHVVITSHALSAVTAAPNTNILGKGKKSHYSPKQLTAANDTAGCLSNPVTSFTITNKGTATEYVTYEDTLGTFGEFFSIAGKTVQSVCITWTGNTEVLGLSNSAGTVNYKSKLTVRLT